MKKTILKTRKFNKETYTFILNEPSYEGEVGCLGMEVDPYISVLTPENCFGYSDTILLSSKNNAYGINRNHPQWIMNKIEDIMIQLTKKYC